ncbi:MAG: M50 family metallopeptidase [Acidiferrobacterales bacterium]
MLESSFRLGTVAGIRIGVHFTWFVIFLLLAFSLTSVFQAAHAEWGRGTALVTAITTSLVFFASIVLHELGHSLVAISRGIPVRAITLFIFGGVAQTEKDADSAATEFWIAIAGPTVSFLLAVLFYLFAIYAQSLSEPVAVACSWLAQINLAVALFNLLPGFPLDGGRVFRAIVWGITGDARRGMQWAFVGGKIVAHGLVLLGLFTVITTGFLLNGLWLAAIGWFLLTAVEASARDFTLRQALRGVTASDIMEHDVPKVPAATSISDWIDHQVLTAGERASLVTENDRVVGLVTLTDSRKIGRTQWGSYRVRDVMTPAHDLRVVRPDTPIMEVMRLMHQFSFNQVPVGRDEAIEGWIDRMRLLQIMQLHVETGR